MNLNTNQRKAVFELTGNTLITASPGSDKTRTLVARAIHNLDIIPKHKSIALITYTNSGADEIAARFIAERNVFIGTIHSFCLEYILRPFSWIYNWYRPCVISYEQRKKFFEENGDIDLEENFGQNKFDELGKIRKKPDGSLDRDVEWNHTIGIKAVADRYFNYQNDLKVIDFNEILFRSYFIVNKNEFVSKSLASKFFEILVDEFQDTNFYQYEILKSINQHSICSFFMVGDSKQRIFSFAGAIENSFEKAQIDFNAKNVELTEVYRSTNQIIKAYSVLFENHPIIENKSDFSDLNIKVSFVETTKANHQAYVENIIKQLLEKNDIKLSEIAILSTSWYAAFPISKVLRKKYNIVGLGALPHKSISNSTISLLRILSKHYLTPEIRSLRGIKRNIDNHLLEYSLQFTQKELNKKTNELISQFLSIQPNVNIVNGIFNLKSIFDTTFNIDHSTFGEILDLISEEEKQKWDIGQYFKTLAGVDGINCNTIHKAKGLEFDVVILNEMNENKIPYQKCICRNPWTFQELTKEDIENGRTLFYVAVSRARKLLIVLHNWKPSMFVEMIKLDYQVLKT